MNQVFQFFLINSIIAVPLFAVIILIRQLLRRHSKRYVYILWCLLMLELVLPAIIPSPISIRGINPVKTETVKEAAADNNNASASVKPLTNNQTVNNNHTANNSVNNTTNNIVNNNTNNNININNSVIETDVKSEDSTVSTKTSAPDNSFSIKSFIADYAWIIWVTVALGMLLFHAFMYFRTRYKVADAIRDEEGVWISDRISSPFILPGLRNRIYMPAGILEEDRDIMLSHERSHLAHRDPIVRMIMNVLLCIHWYNPIVWAAVNLMIQDMEMLCDESALRDKSSKERAEYSKILVSYSTKRRSISPVIAFGESNTEKRVKHILFFKRPAFIGTAATIVVAVVFAVIFMTNAVKSQEKTEPDTQEETTTEEETTIEDGTADKKFDDTWAYTKDYNGDGQDEILLFEAKESLNIILYDSEYNRLAHTFGDFDSYDEIVVGTKMVEGRLQLMVYSKKEILYYSNYNYELFELTEDNNFRLIGSNIIRDVVGTSNNIPKEDMVAQADYINSFFENAEIVFHYDTNDYGLKSYRCKDTLDITSYKEVYEIYGDYDNARDNLDKFSVIDMVLERDNLTEADFDNAARLTSDIWNDYDSKGIFIVDSNSEFDTYMVLNNFNEFYLTLRSKGGSMQYIDSDPASMHHVMPKIKSGDFDGDGRYELVISGNVYTGTGINGYDLDIVDDVTDNSHTIVRMPYLINEITEDITFSMKNVTSDIDVKYKGNYWGTIITGEITNEDYIGSEPSFSGNLGPYFDIQDNTIYMTLIPVIPNKVTFATDLHFTNSVDWDVIRTRLTYSNDGSFSIDNPEIVKSER